MSVLYLTLHETRHEFTGCLLPTAVLRPCSTQGCPKLTCGAPCEQHRRARQREHDERRGTSTERGYDAVHRRLRILCFQRDGWRCVDCDWEPEIVKQCREFDLDFPPTEQILEALRRAFTRGQRHLHADHEIPIAVRPDLRLDLDNLRTRCNGCHRAKTNRESVRTATGRGNQSLGSEAPDQAMPIRENSRLLKEILGGSRKMDLARPYATRKLVS